VVTINKINFASLPNISSEYNLQLSGIYNLLRRNAISMPNISITENSSRLLKDVIVTIVLSNETDQPKTIMNDMNLIKCKSLPNISTSLESGELSKLNKIKCLRHTAFSMPNLYTIVADGQEEQSDLIGAQELTPVPEPSTQDTTRRKRKSFWCRTKKFMRRMLCCSAYS
jgi:hypothetical protein